eukprot:TRINITY_DN2540_c0_g3_i3.p2 TRINITY_DN2540_c0_g3~~TRINITY_DN2540_c0_g3_i3.p2  ORF type:complete len:238 (+),score=15.29 TRINITY_DN2540_c0_g3_i3:66-779(+)
MCIRDRFKSDLFSSLEDRELNFEYQDQIKVHFRGFLYPSETNYLWQEQIIRLLSVLQANEEIMLFITSLDLKEDIRTLDLFLRVTLPRSRLSSVFLVIYKLTSSPSTVKKEVKKQILLTFYQSVIKFAKFDELLNIALNDEQKQVLTEMLENNVGYHEFLILYYLKNNQVKLGLDIYTKQISNKMQPSNEIKYILFQKLLKLPKIERFKISQQFPEFQQVYNLENWNVMEIENSQNV